MRRTPLLAATCVAACLAACDRETRDFRHGAGMAGIAEVVRVAELQPGPATPRIDAGAYQENRWAVSEGLRLYHWFNCADCHAPGGGGGIGPRFRQGRWIYGSSPANVYASIMQGRPDGMPAYGGRLDPADAWKLVAYVRSLDGLTPRDTWPARSDRMSDTNPRRGR